MNIFAAFIKEKGLNISRKIFWNVISTQYEWKLLASCKYLLLPALLVNMIGLQWWPILQVGGALFLEARCPISQLTGLFMPSFQPSIARSWNDITDNSISATFKFRHHICRCFNFFAKKKWGISRISGGSLRYLRDSACSFHWLSSSIFSFCLFIVVTHRWHLLSSPQYDVSEHTNHIFSVRIWSWQHVSVNISSVAELSPVYCCLVLIHILWTGVSVDWNVFGLNFGWTFCCNSAVCWQNGKTLVQFWSRLYLVWSMCKSGSVRTI